MNKREQLWSDYKKRVKDINDKHKKAVEIAGNVYRRAVDKLDREDRAKLANLAGGATVGKPKRSKSRGPGTRS